MNYQTTREDAELIEKIAQRAGEVLESVGISRQRFDVVKDITACHVNHAPLKLDELLAADQGDFIFDVLGILLNIDRYTGKLQNGFVPRFQAEPR